MALFEYSWFGYFPFFSFIWWSWFSGKYPLAWNITNLHHLQKKKKKMLGKSSNGNESTHLVVALGPKLTRNLKYIHHPIVRVLSSILKTCWKVVNDECFFSRKCLFCTNLDKFPVLDVSGVCVAFPVRQFSDKGQFVVLHAAFDLKASKDKHGTGFSLNGCTVAAHPSKCVVPWMAQIFFALWRQNTFWELRCAGDLNSRVLCTTRAPRPGLRISDKKISTIANLQPIPSPTAKKKKKNTPE